MKFGDNLKKLRKLSKLSQEDLAEKVGVSRQSVSKWECGESYPEMNNILTLCHIFGCKINDLVQENLMDIDQLGEDVKMSVVKFKKEKQKKMKGLSKAIYVIARILRIFVLLGLVLATISLIAIPFIGSKVKLDKNTIQYRDKVYHYTIDEKHLTVEGISDNNRFDIDFVTDSNLQEYIENHSVTYFVFVTECVLICLIITIIFMDSILKYLEKLFKNIHNGDTPFTLENIKYIRKIALFLILLIAFPTIGGFLCEGITSIDMNVEIEFMTIILVLVVLSLAYIFEYGYQIQQDSKGKMYGEENE